MAAAFSQAGTVAELLFGLDNIRKQDVEAERQVSVAGRNALPWWIGFGLSIAALFFGGAASASGGVLAFFVFTLVLCLVFGIYWSVRKSAWSKEDIEDRRFELATRFLQILGQDVPKKGKCRIFISFADYQQHGKMVERQGGGFLNSTTNYKYEDPWFLAVGKLIDGNRFKISIDQSIHRKEVRKRKYTKIKERWSEQITLCIQVSPTSYPDTAKLTSLIESPSFRTTLPTNIQVTGALFRNGLIKLTCVTQSASRVKGRYGTQGTGMEHLASGDSLLQMFIHTYAQLQQCLPAAANPGIAPA